MKKSVLYKAITGTVLVAATLLSGNYVNAQRKSSRDNNNLHEDRYKSTRLRPEDRTEKVNKSTYRIRNNNDSKKSHKANRVKSYYRDHHSKSHELHKYNHKKYHKKHQYKHKAHKGYNKHGYKHYKKYRHYKHHHQHYNYHRYRHFYNHHGHSCYHHSRYGNVVVRFACEPIVIHHRYGDYYYADRYYYRYYPEIGFIEVEPPRAVYFSYIPDDCQRVTVHGDVYYTNGELCFVRHRKGFRLVSAPSGFHLSVKF